MQHSELDTAQQILSATEKLMAEQGLHTLSMQKIAQAAGISVGTIYIYFKNKEYLTICTSVVILEHIHTLLLAYTMFFQ